MWKQNQLLLYLPELEVRADDPQQLQGQGREEGKIEQGCQKDRTRRKGGNCF